ncbi:MAG: 50S ribosomal protein L20 [Bacilli bacterium]|nr:50S ribosomal protein L20 [Bacilli bacterium]
MMRVKGGNRHEKRAKLLKFTSGYFGSKHRLYKTMNEARIKALAYAKVGRRLRKRDFRKLWITRISAACRLNDISYSKFVAGLRKANIQINRKMLSELAIADPKAFTQIVDQAKKALGEAK